MEISLADVQDLALENFLLRRDLKRAQAANEELSQLIALHQEPEAPPADSSTS